MKWLMVLAVTILHNENSFPPKTYELRAYTSFGHCSQAKADIDYIFKDKHETVVVVAECYTEEGYKSYLEDMQKNKDKGRHSASRCAPSSEGFVRFAGRRRGGGFLVYLSTAYYFFASFGYFPKS